MCSTESVEGRRVYTRTGVLTADFCITDGWCVDEGAQIPEGQLGLGAVCVGCVQIHPRYLQPDTSHSLYHIYRYDRAFITCTDTHMTGPLRWAYHIHTSQGFYHMYTHDRAFITCTHMTGP